MQTCGNTQMPALFSLASQIGSSTDRGPLVDQLRQSKKSGEEWRLETASSFYTPELSNEGIPTGRYLEADEIVGQPRSTHTSDAAFSTLLTIAPTGLNI
jgi:hypothetical protein